jgi:hypothetical protein
MEKCNICLENCEVAWQCQFCLEGKIGACCNYKIKTYLCGFGDYWLDRERIPIRCFICRQLNWKTCYNEVISDMIEILDGEADMFYSDYESELPPVVQKWRKIIEDLD